MYAWLCVCVCVYIFIGRLGIVTFENSNDFLNMASFEIMNSLSKNNEMISFGGYGNYSDYYITINQKLEGGCSNSYESPQSDVILQNINEIYNYTLASWLITTAVNPSRLVFLGYYFE